MVSRMFEKHSNVPHIRKKPEMKHTTIISAMLLVCIVPLVAMLAYIFMRLYALAESPDAVQLIVMSGVVFTSLACAVAVSQYRRHERNCRELMAQFEER